MLKGTTALEEVKRIKSRLEIRFNDHLCEMKPEHDDSITGFNEASEIALAVLGEELTRLAAAPPPPDDRPFTVTREMSAAGNLAGGPMADNAAEPAKRPDALDWGPVYVSPEEFDELERSLQTPQKPTDSILRGAQFLRDYAPARREAEAAEREREACARVADGFACGACGMDGKAAAAIRSRSQSAKAPGGGG